MIRLTWRQFRTQAEVAFGALVVVAVILAITGTHLVHLYDALVADCQARGDCAFATKQFVNHYQLLQLLGSVVVVVPGVIGVFWGAPLAARELEAGTLGLAWTQSVGRTRWLAVKLAVVGLASMAAAGLFSLAVTWWSSPIDRVNLNRFGAGMFGERGITPIGYAAFAFVLGVTAGVLIRRTLPAMATTLVVFLAARLTFTLWVRPHLLAPTVRDFALTTAPVGFGSTNGGPMTLFPDVPNIPGAWIYAPKIVDPAGHGLTAQVVASACPNLGAAAPPPGSGAGFRERPAPGGVGGVLHECLTKLGATYHEVVAYQPASRYWAFQWYETAIFVGLALAFAGLCFWLVRRRLP
jgi:hypothetical protein